VSYEKRQKLVEKGIEKAVNQEKATLGARGSSTLVGG
jgi:hypothetical protein